MFHRVYVRGSDRTMTYHEAEQTGRCGDTVTSVIRQNDGGTYYIQDIELEYNVERS